MKTSEMKTLPGPCALCGDENYALSLGGPSVCPACDCGSFHDEALAHKRLMGFAPPPTRNERAEVRERRAKEAEKLVAGVFTSNDVEVLHENEDEAATPTESAE